MKNIRYIDFDLAIERTGDGYRTRVLSSPAGQAEAEFALNLTDLELENFFLRVGQTRRSVRRINSPEMESAKYVGGRLFNALFKDDVRGCLRSSLDEANRQEVGLRLRLRLSGVPEMVDLPWEYLYNSSLNRFLCLSAETPLIRYIELPERIRPLTIRPPLKLLVVISSPSDYPPLDVDREWEKLNEALHDLVQQGLLTVERLVDGQMMTLQRRLRQSEYHIFHFVGHGGFITETQDGVLLLEDEAKRGRQVSGQDLGTLLHDQRALRLVVLNACEGARTSRSDPFAGTAQSLIQQRIPAVIAMQFEITDAAAITLAHEFYGALADGYPVDAALGEARKALFAEGNDVEWGTPVLYLRASDGRVFDVERVSEEEKKQTQVVALDREAQAAIEKENWAAAIEKWQAVLALDPQQKRATEKLNESQQQQKLANLYAQGMQDLDAHRWKEALNSFQGIKDLQSNYKDVETLLGRIATELERQAPLVPKTPATVITPKAQIEKPKGWNGWLIGIVGAVLLFVCGIVGAVLLFVCMTGLGVYAFGPILFPQPTSQLNTPIAILPSRLADTPTPKPVDTATRELTATPQPTDVSTAAATPTPWLTSTPFNTPTLIPTPTNPPPPTALPSTPIPPGVYVTAIRVDPGAPKRGQPVLFHVTFLNTTANPASFRWRIRIYKPNDLRNALGDTSPLNVTVPLGTSDQVSADNWKLTGIIDCNSLLAQAYWVDPSTKQEGEFQYVDRNRVTLPFQVCP